MYLLKRLSELNFQSLQITENIPIQSFCTKGAKITFMDLKQTPPLMKEMHVGLRMVIDTPHCFCHKLNAPNS
jgi:hypothetical protein